MLIGVVSDTHGRVDFARQAVRVLEGFPVKSVIHCGDIGSVAIVPKVCAVALNSLSYSSALFW